MKTKRFLSILLSLVLVIGMLPGMSLTASAAGNTTEITPTNTSGTMTITLTIKAAQTITASDVTATYGDTDKSVSASVTTPASGGGAISYAVKTGSEDYIDVAADGKLTIKAVPPTDGKAYVIVTAAETDDYAETTKEVTVNISTKAMTVSASDVTATADGQPHGITVNVTDPATGYTVKYGTEEGSYTLDASPTQTEVGEKTVYYQVTADNYTTYTGSAKVTVSAKSAQTITAFDVTATYGDTGKKIEASTTGDGGLSYVVKSGDAVTVDASGNLTIVKAGSAVITVTAAETDTYAQATKDVNVTVNTKAMTVSAEDVNVTVDGQAHGITVTVTDPASGATVKYGTEAGSYTLDASPTQTEVGEKTVYYQLTADNYTTYTGSAKVTVSAKQTQTITAADVTATYGDTGVKINASTTGDGGLSYAVKSGDAVTVNETTGALTIVKAGSAIITVTASETATYEPATKEVTVTINKANAVAATVTANNRTFDGTEKPLVTVTGEATGGTMQYALGTATEATQPYTTSIPAKTDAGIYYVWYKVIGDENHADSDAKCVTVTIGRRSSSGGSSSAPSTPTTPTESYTVPVSSEKTVNVTTNISNGNAVVSEITQSDIDKIVNDGNNSGSGENTGASENTSIIIDVSQAKSEVTSVQLSEKTVEKLTEAVKADNNVESVEIKMTNATIELDGTALSAVSEQAEGSSIKLVVEDTQTTKLNATQQESLRQFASAKPFQAYFESNGKEIHDFKGGKATVSIKFSPESGRDVKHYHMYYLPVAGAIERYVTRYVDGMLSFVTTHFSDYAIVYDETMKNETGKDDGTGSESENGSQTDSSSGNTANGKTSYQNALSINKGLKVSQTGSEITVSWGKVSGADRYEIYAAYCTDKFGKKPVKIVTKKDVTSVTITKLNDKKLVLTKNFKAYVVAYKTVDGSKKKLGKTITAHIVGRKNKTYTNVKAIKLAKNKATIKVGKTYKIKASVVLVDSKKKMLSDKHAATFRYASSDRKIATVDKNGKVTAKKKGTCYVWIYAKNGYANKVKVTVK